MMRVRCKLIQIADQPGGCKLAIFEPVGNSGIGSEFRFARKPDGKIELAVDNPLALRVLESAQEFYFDLVPIME